MTLTPTSFAGPRAFARWALQDERLMLRPLLHEVMTFDGQFVEAILFREGPWQIELIAALPNASTEVHRHLRCSSADLLLTGSIAGQVEGRGVDVPKRGPLAAQLKTIGRNEWHGGSGGPHGTTYLSFQQWWGGEPTFISQDWESWKP